MSSLFTQYKEQSLNTMSKGEQLVALFDEALKNARYASIMFKNNNIETALKCTEKCKKIFTYLITILDRKQEISSNLYNLYTFFNQEIIKAEVKRDNTPIDEIMPIIEDMRNTWDQAVKLVNINK